MNLLQRVSCAGAFAAGLLLTGCGGGGGTKAEAPTPKAPEKPASPIVFASGPRPKPPAGCEWIEAKTDMPGDEALFYRAAKCQDKTRTLFFSAGAHRADLSYTEGGPPVVQIFTAEPGEGDAAILRRVREGMTPKAAALCSIRPAGIDSWPADAKVADVSAAEAAKAPKNEPRTACGQYGLNQDAQVFWRVFQGYAWYFDLGQDEFEIDPGSLTIASKDAQGNWKPVQN